MAIYQNTVTFSRYENKISELINDGWRLESKAATKAKLSLGSNVYLLYASNV